MAKAVDTAGVVSDASRSHVKAQRYLATVVNNDSAGVVASAFDSIGHMAVELGCMAGLKKADIVKAVADRIEASTINPERDQFPGSPDNTFEAQRKAFVLAVKANGTTPIRPVRAGK